MLLFTEKLAIYFSALFFTWCEHGIYLKFAKGNTVILSWAKGNSFEFHRIMRQKEIFLTRFNKNMFKVLDFFFLFYSF